MNPYIKVRCSILSIITSVYCVCHKVTNNSTNAHGITASHNCLYESVEDCNFLPITYIHIRREQYIKYSARIWNVALCVNGKLLNTFTARCIENNMALCQHIYTLQIRMVSWNLQLNTSMDRNSKAKYISSTKATELFLSF